MRLVKFTHTSDETVYINPDHVTHIGSGSHEVRTCIYILHANRALEVFGTVAQVAAKLLDMEAYDGPKT